MTKINIKKLLSARIFALIGLALLIILSLSGPAIAQSVNQGYSAEESLQRGMLVKEKDNDPSKVEALHQANLDKLKGVVVQQNDSPITLSSEGQSVFVADSGVFEVLVSDENGSIKAGDYLSISSLAGIAMKANDSQNLVLGRAVSGFDSSSDTVGASTDPNTKKQLRLGRIRVAIAIDSNPWKKDDTRNNIPAVLEEVSTTIAGKRVSTERVWLALAVFIGTTIIVCVMLYGGARSGIISVGRNPLSKDVIMKGLGRIVLSGLAVFILGMFGVYLLLKL